MCTVFVIRTRTTTNLRIKLCFLTSFLIFIFFVYLLVLLVILLSFMNLFPRIEVNPQLLFKNDKIQKQSKQK